LLTRFVERLLGVTLPLTFLSQRIVDDVPRIIDFSIIHRLPSAISHALLEHLVSGGDSEIRRLMSESPEVAEERAELNMRKKRLEEAKKVLLAFGRTV
jgi:hypothetical protein